MKFCYVTNIFDLHTFDYETTVLKNFFEIFTEMHFVNLTFDDTFKMYFMHYANLNSSSINKPYLRAAEYAALFFFRFLIYVYFNETF